MSFKVCRVKSTAELDSLPVAVITNYPLERRDYKPYAQCNLCTDGKSLLLRMWAFEVSPPPKSELRAVLYLFPNKEGAALHVVMRPDGECCLTLCENGEFLPWSLPSGFYLNPHSGEDLQGVYWGGLIMLPLDWLNGIAEAVELKPGGVFPGNFYKLCGGPDFGHKGSYFPADFLGDCFGRESMGEFLAVSY